MKILSSTMYVRGVSRWMMGMLTAVVFLTSIHVQAASASEQNAMVTVDFTTDVVKTDDAVSTRTLRVPTRPPQAAFVEAPVKKTAPSKKRVWNTIQAPDLITIPEHSSEIAIRTVTVATTAYTSDPRETDGSPFTTANGTQVRDGIVAANFLPFGTRVRIPDYFGDKVFEVHDRMNARYTQRVDIWMLTKKEAKQWGVRKIKLEILP
jgi:3D (Asp-Asp-Asp) domain-containing protein